MTLKLKRGVLIVLGLLAVAMGLRLYLIYRSRHEAWNLPQTPKVKLTSDDYVVPTKLHAYDLNSLRELVGKPVWIRSGYQLAYYPYTSSTKRVDFDHKAGLLGPIEKIEIKDVVQQPTPEKLAWQVVPGSKVRVRVRSHELMAIFDKEGKSYAFTLGYENGSDKTILADDILYYEDPHELYKHWPADVWSAIDRHQAQPGMNELQVQFAIGGPAGMEAGSERVLIYDNGGKPLRVVFIEGKAEKIEAASS
jgi:hypothetical protein